MFPMQAKLPEREPEIIFHWNEEKQYERLQSLNDLSLFVLHDGPPYANGHLHMGHALNKILKDMINRLQIKKNLRPVYRPGWDCHGLPIEHRVLEELKKSRSELSPTEIRTRCRESALKYVEIQKKEFQRMGILADWDHPYLTMEFGYESDILKAFSRIVRDGRVYKGVKPVLWCPNCETALADAEVEYEDHRSLSATVLFPEIRPDNLPRRFYPIWTTTPWTLPANRAVALNPQTRYLILEWTGTDPEGLFRLGDQVVIGADLWQDGGGYAGFAHFRHGFVIQGTVSGQEILAGSPLLRSPLSGIPVPLVAGEFVTLDQGTGMVHIAPGHGEEDYALGRALNLEIYAPLDNRGRYTEDLPPALKNLVGRAVQKIDAEIIDLLKNLSLLVEAKEYSHSYPHCWRCKKPVLFRATPQWFLSLSEGHLREKTLEAIKSVNWIPSRGENRITGMIASRPDWCLSRQRAWGIPIPAFSCEKCRHGFIDPDFVLRLSEHTRLHGVDVWFEPVLPTDLLDGLSCPKCLSTELTRENDILDVWFDSGVSHMAVLKDKEGTHWPADLYLEGSDQHRGWFHSSILTSMALYDAPPYKQVLTHGFVVDGQGRKMSKSLKNVISPLEIVEKYGAEILRLWAASSDYREDIRLSEVILSQLVESYRKIRNTFRFLVSNLYDFPENRSVEVSKAAENSPDLLDQWILSLWESTKEKIFQAYQDYEFGRIMQLVSQFCSVSLSAHYFDMVKDRLYISLPDSPERRHTQSTMRLIGQELLICLSPVLVFTSDELEPYLFGDSHDPFGRSSIHFRTFPESRKNRINTALEKRMETLLAFRGEIGQMMDELKKSKTVGSGLETEVILSGNISGIAALEGVSETFLSTFLIVSGVRIGQGVPDLKEKAGLTERESEAFPGVTIALYPATGLKCERCWTFSAATGENPEKWPVCSRCYPIVLKWPGLQSNQSDRSSSTLNA